jgi:glycosyltransferase involved in cell wall biosynthesis
MNGHGRAYLKQSFDMLVAQTFKDFEVVISDHSKDDAIANLCKEYEGVLAIVYHHNTEGIGSSSANINNAIRHAGGTLIKILFQDDFLYHERALEDIVHAFDLQHDQWLVTACIHTDDGVTFYRPFYPHCGATIYLGNTISSPSVVTIKNNHPLLFDEQLVWLMDVEYYKRCYDAFGKPKILNTINIVNRSGSHQVSKTLASTIKLREKEFSYVAGRYEHGSTFWYHKTIHSAKELLKKLLGI